MSIYGHCERSCAIECPPWLLAKTLGYAVSFSSPWRGKRCFLEWRKPVFMDQLQLSTNADKLSETCSISF